MSTEWFVFSLVSSFDEIASLAAVEAAAMLPQPFNTCFFLPTISAEQQEAFFRNKLEGKWAARHITRTRFMKAVGVHTGEVEGFVLWSLNGRDSYLNDQTEQKPKTELEAPIEAPEQDSSLLSPQASVWAEGAYALHRRITKQFATPESRWIYLDKMYVRPRSQRKGLATALWHRGPSKEADTGLHLGPGGVRGSTSPLLVLTVAVGSTWIFYESVGFRAVDRSLVRLDEATAEGSGFGTFWFTGMVREVESTVLSRNLVLPGDTEHTV